jgi:hypothetical protein
MARKKKQGFVKKQFELSSDDLEKLGYLEQRHDLTSEAHVVRLGIRVLYKISKLKDEGRNPGYLNEDEKFEEFVFLELL